MYNTDMNLILVMRLIEKETSKDGLIKLIQQNGDRYDSILENAQRKFKDDIDVVRAATTFNVTNIKYASERLQNDEELAIELVQRKGSVLRYLGNDVRGNRRIVLAAIREDGMAIQYAAEELWDDEEIVADAIQQNSDVIDWLDSLKTD